MLTRNVDAWHYMGLTYLETERLEQAIRCFEKVLSLEERADTRRFLEQAYERMTD